MSEKAYDSTVLSEKGYSNAGDIDLNKELTGENTNSVLMDVLLGAGGLAGGSKLVQKLMKNVPWLKRMKGSHFSPRSESMQRRAFDPDLYDSGMKNSPIKDRIYDTIKRGTVTGKGPGSLIDYAKNTLAPPGILRKSYSAAQKAGVKSVESSSRILDFIKDKAPTLLPFLYGGGGGVALDRTFNPEGGWDDSPAGAMMDRVPESLRPDPEMPSKEELDDYIKLYGDYNKWKKADEAKPANLMGRYGNPFNKSY